MQGERRSVESRTRDNGKGEDEQSDDGDSERHVAEDIRHLEHHHAHQYGELHHEN